MQTLYKNIKQLLQVRPEGIQRVAGFEMSILPKIELPKGGGAINGMGEKFSVNALNGTGTASIPIPVSPTRNDFSPQLSLGYDSGAGNSAFGLGWDIGVSSITRKTSKGIPQYQDQEESDVFMLSGMEDLVPFLEEENNWERKIKAHSNYTIYYYRPRTEGGFSRIEKWVHKELKRHGKKIAIEKVYYVDSISLIEPFIRWKYKKCIYKVGYQSGYFDFKRNMGNSKKTYIKLPYYRGSIVKK